MFDHIIKDSVIKNKNHQSIQNFIENIFEKQKKKMEFEKFFLKKNGSWNLNITGITKIKFEIKNQKTIFDLKN